jgi:hypothetical protein
MRTMLTLLSFVALSVAALQGADHVCKVVGSLADFLRT